MICDLVSSRRSGRARSPASPLSGVAGVARLFSREKEMPAVAYQTRSHSRQDSPQLKKLRARYEPDSPEALRQAEGADDDELQNLLPIKLILKTSRDGSMSPADTFARTVNRIASSRYRCRSSKETKVVQIIRIDFNIILVRFR